MGSCVPSRSAPAKYVAVAAIAAAITDPALLRMFQLGALGRIGFAVYAWSQPGCGRTVLNLLTNGFPSGDCDPAIMRDVAAEQDVTLNALISVPIRSLARYYRSEIVGGVGAFALEFSGLEDFSAAVSRKFILDMAALIPRGIQ